MTLPMGDATAPRPAVEVHAAAADEWDLVRRVDELAFGYTWHEDLAAERGVVELDRFLVARVAGRPVGIGAAFSLSMGLPGGLVAPVAGVTWVGVLPTHRRQGVLTALMRRQLDDLHEHGEAVAALYASESVIYGRFGYGTATWKVSAALPHGTPLDVPPGLDAGLTATLEDASDDHVRRGLAAVHEAVLRQRPGGHVRDDRWWARRLADPPSRREGRSELRVLLVRDGEGAPRAYALFATKQVWDNGYPEGLLDVREALAVDGAGSAALWRVLLGHDLVATVDAWNLAVDDTLVTFLAEPRRARLGWSESLHVRLVRVGEALTARRYAQPVDVVLEVADAFAPWNTGRWRLSGDATGAVCAPTTDPPDLRLTSRELGGAFLGGTALSALARAGRVEELTPGSLAASTSAFLSDPAPHSPEIF